MKYCTKCGSHMADDAKFCSKCGNTTYTPQPQADVCMPTMTPAIRVLKTLGSSLLFLVAVIFTSISELLTIFNTIRSSNDFLGLAYFFANEMDMPHEVFELIQTGAPVIAGIGIMLSGISVIVSLAWIIGLWLIYTTCRNKGDGKINPLGFTLMKIINIMECVGLVLLFAFITLLMFISILVSFNGYGGMEMAIAMLIILFVIIIIVAFLVVLYVKIIKSINSAEKVIATGRPDINASKFVGIFCILTTVCFVYNAGALAMQLISLADTSFAYPLAEAIRNLSTYVCLAVGCACFAIIIFKYRAQMSAVVAATEPPAAEAAEEDIPAEDYPVEEAPAEEPEKTEE